MKRQRAILFACTIVFLWVGYRAGVTAVTRAEATAYNHYSSQSTATILASPYDPANQILHSLLCRFTVHIVRATEWWLRLPSLLGLLFYFWAAIRVCRVLCKPGNHALTASLFFVLNPFAIGWLPISTGIWMGAGLFLLATAQLVPFLWEDVPDQTRLWKASLLFGTCVGFHISLFLPSLALVFLVLHIEFWGLRRIAFWAALNNLLLPFGLLVFALWSLSFLSLIGPIRIEMLCVVVFPGLAVLALPWFTVNRNVWRAVGPTAIILALVPTTGMVPDLFHPGPEAAMPKIARALRDELRRLPPRSVTVATSNTLLESVSFYRRRYALGAVKPIDSKLQKSSADYLILLRGDVPEPNFRMIIQAGNLALFARDPG